MTLREADVTRKHRCAAGSHVVFVGTAWLPSMVMRGQMMDSVLNQTLETHGVTSSYITVSSPTNTTKFSTMIESHFDSIGVLAACIIIKYSVAWVGAACRRRGALVFVDSIDNHRAYSAATLNNEHYSAMDAIIVQTEAHAQMVGSWGHLGVVLPHPHGNLGGWGVADTVRPRVRGVGFVVQDNKNMPTREDLRGIMRACCRVNATLYLVASKGSSLEIKPMNQHHNCSQILNSSVADGWNGADRASLLSQPTPAPACLSRRGGIAAAGNFSRSSLPSRLRDPTRQRRYYDSPQLLDLIDVGLVWRPGHQQGGKIAVDNRPPTRLHWWWSHGIPAIGYPMPAYLDAARRARYPEELLNLTTSSDIERALLQIASADERSCIQQSAMHGACLSSPWYTSLELLAAICAVGERCGRPLQAAQLYTQTSNRSHHGHGFCPWVRRQSSVPRAGAGDAHGRQGTGRPLAPAGASTRRASPKPGLMQQAQPLGTPSTSADPLAVDISIFDFPISFSQPSHKIKK